MLHYLLRRIRNVRPISIGRTALQTHNLQRMKGAQKTEERATKTENCLRVSRVHAGVCLWLGEKRMAWQVNRQSVALRNGVQTPTRRLANLTVHPHAKRCTYLGCGAFTLERVCKFTCAICDPGVQTMHVSARFYLPSSLSFSRFSHPLLSLFPVRLWTRPYAPSSPETLLLALSPGVLYIRPTVTTACDEKRNKSGEK